MKDEYMSDEMFAELLESVREGGAILRGEREASRRFEIESPNVRLIRERFDLSPAPSSPE
jgi:putative transcriptional regulator